MTLSSDQKLLTVTDAARYLKVSPATIWRWINAGKLKSLRVGPKSIRVQMEDLESVIQPARASHDAKPVPSNDVIYTPDNVPPLTDDERKRALETLHKIDALREEISRRNGNKLFPDSVDLIREMRDERAKHLDEL